MTLSRFLRCEGFFHCVARYTCSPGSLLGTPREFVGEDLQRRVWGRSAEESVGENLQGEGSGGGSARVGLGINLQEEFNEKISREGFRRRSAGGSGRGSGREGLARNLQASA